MYIYVYIYIHTHAHPTEILVGRNKPKEYKVKIIIELFYSVKTFCHVLKRTDTLKNKTDGKKTEKKKGEGSGFKV